MNVTNPTPEQVTEIAARSVYLMHNWLYWKKSYEVSRTEEYRKLLELWEVRIEEFLKGIGSLEWESLKSIISQLTIKK